MRGLTLPSVVYSNEAAKRKHVAGRDGKHVPLTSAASNKDEPKIGCIDSDRRMGSVRGHRQRGAEGWPSANKITSAGIISMASITK